MRALKTMRSLFDTTFYIRILKRIGLIVLLLVAFQLQGQTIASLEYYFGTDPGFGNGTTISADPNTGNVIQDLSIPITGLDEGFHTLSLRALDDGGNYSLYSASTFFVIESGGAGGVISNLAAAEYWFDTDPGFGNGTTLAITGSPSEVAESYAIPLGTLASGFHTLGVRVQNLNGDWSLYTKSIFYIFEPASTTPISNLAAAEYWFDADPGFGNGETLAIPGSPSDFAESYVIPLGTLEEGFHTIGIRAQNLDGIWSLYSKNIFYVSEIAGIDPISNLAALEYWFDTDPGFGNGTAIAISGSPDAYTDDLIIPLGPLEGGYHEIGIRAQSLDGTWSLYEKRRFFIIDAAEFATPAEAPLDEIEFLYDAELGFGTGTSLAFTPTGNTDEYLVEIPTDLVTCDLHDVWVSMKNTDGNYSLYKILSDVDVFDNLDPTLVVFPDITVALDANGEGSITLDDVNNGTFDDCELVSVVLNEAQFDYTCANLGANTVTITATDAENKVSTQNVTITVVDNIDPVAVAQDITVALGANGTVSISADDLENGSTDNCSIASNSVDITSFDCTNLGVNTVNFTVTDPEGNTNAVSTEVTIVDTTDPDAVTQNVTVQLDAAGVASITADDLDQSTDNCTIASNSLDITSFDCDDLGANTVTLTVTDQSGNSNTAMATVTIEDTIAPNAIAQNITVQLDANGDASITADAIDNGSTDNCTIASRSLDISTFDCSSIGENTVTLSVTDQSGGVGTATAVVTVADGVNPVAISQNITVQLDTSGSVTVAADAVDNNSTDNCAIDMRSLDVSTFSCDDIGPNTVTLTVTDASGNQNSTGATITVEDVLAPNVLTQNVTVQLDASGAATITVDDIDNGSTDNCGIASRSLDLLAFDCSDVGPNTVTLSVTDTSGVIGTATAVVTVVDSIDPVAVPSTTTITLELDANGNGSLTGTSYDGGSTDNCGIASDTVFPSDYACADIGPNAATFEVTDNSGNTATAAVTVDVVDNLDPVALGQDITVSMAETGTVSIVASDVDNGSSDNCGAAVLSIDVDTFIEVGIYPVVLTVTDSSGNTSMVTVNVTVTDSLSIDDVEYDSNAISLYPNPASDRLFFKTELVISNVKVLDLTGKQVLQQSNSLNYIAVSDLSEGVYFIQFKIENTIITKRFVKH